MGVTFTSNPFLLNATATSVGVTGLGTQVLCHSPVSLCHPRGGGDPASEQIIPPFEKEGQGGILKQVSIAKTSLFATYEKLLERVVLPNIETINRTSLISSGPFTALAHGLLTSIGMGAASGLIPLAGNTSDNTNSPDIKCPDTKVDYAAFITAAMKTLTSILGTTAVHKKISEEIAKAEYIEVYYDGIAEIWGITDAVQFGRRYLATVEEVIEEAHTILKKGGDKLKWRIFIAKAIVGHLATLCHAFLVLFREDHSIEVSSIRHNIIEGMKYTLFLLAQGEPDAAVRIFDKVNMPVEGDDIHADILRAIRYPRAFAESMKVNIRYDIPRGLHLREGLDRSSFVQQFVDLVWNAVKYHDYRLGDDGKDIKKVRFIRLSWDISCEAFVVEDNGSGIEHPERVFEPLYREAERYKEEIHGTGMGLANTRDYFESIGGKIEVESEVNVGSRFIITPKPGDVIDTSISNRIARAAMEGSDDDFGKLMGEIGAMGQESLLRTAVQMFNVVDAAVEKFVREFKKVEVNDLEQLNKFSGLWRSRIKRMNEMLSLLRDRSSDIHHKIIAAFNSSILQTPTSIGWTLESLRDHVGLADLRGIKKFKDILTSINIPKESAPIDGLGYLIPPSRQELISFVLAATGFYSSKEKRRDGSDIVFVVPRLLTESDSMTVRVIGIKYPPDPAEDTVLRTYLDVLGWDLKIEDSSGADITYRLNFGKMTLIDENI